MPLPKLDDGEVAALVGAASDVQYLAQGGQKMVFACTLDGKPHVLKFLLLGPARAKDPAATDPDLSTDPVGPTFARAVREVATMSQCNCPTLVRLGPVGLQRAEVKGQDLLYFSEQRIDGDNLADVLTKAGPLPVAELFTLAEDVTEAIKAIWAFAKIHRDIKPGNIVRRTSDARFVLLDAGLVLDLGDESITATGFIVGTMKYFSPEQMEFNLKRQLDFRSDLFALGIVLYEMATGAHPFAGSGMTTQDILLGIATTRPVPPRQIRAEISFEFEQIILRLLGKRPHLRYRTCDQLLDAVKAARTAYQAAGGKP